MFNLYNIKYITLPMKKILTLIAIVVFVAALLVSCGSTKTCPAYSSTDVEHSDTDNC